MPDAVAPPSERDSRFQHVLLAYVEAAEAGQAPDQEQFLAAHSEFAEEISEFIAGQEQFEDLAEPLRWVVQAILQHTSSTDTPVVQNPDPANMVATRVPILRAITGYDLLQEIGRGGMGVVYLARQATLHRLVALKMIRAGELATLASMQRFRNEAEAAANLDHPHIVPIFEVGEHEGRLFFSMKYIEGGSIATQLARFQDEPRAAAQLVAAIAQAVHHAHQRGILHRDLKPANILLDKEGRPFVSDFGLAKRLADDLNLTTTGELIGTPGYMAPEQADGGKEAISTATDVYGLGAVLYALLTGQPPFRADSILATLEQVRTREPNAPGGSNRRVERDLECICLKCLEKEPERRYSSAQAVADDLKRWLAGEAIQARRVGWPARLWRWSKRNRMVASLSVVALVLLLCLIIGLATTSFLIWRQQGRTRQALELAIGNTVTLNNGVTDMLMRLEDKTLVRFPEIQELRRSLTQTTLDLLRATAQREEEFGDAHLADGDTCLFIGATYRSMGARPQAQEAYRRAIAIYERYVAQQPHNQRFRYSLGQGYAHLGLDLWDTGQFAEARPIFEKAAAAYRQALTVAPDDPGSLRYMAWFLSSCPVRDYRDPAWVVQLAERLVRLEPERESNWVLLRLAYYRNANWSSALAVPDAAGPQPNGCHMKDEFIKAMVYWQSNEHKRARALYDRAEVWMEKHRPSDVEFRLFRAEAAELMGIHGQIGESPRSTDASPIPSSGCAGEKQWQVSPSCKASPYAPATMKSAERATSGLLR
jgi:tRNA A-37 threonylcarbamoyl transferase component Bud32